jgi:hypothetical protein
MSEAVARARGLGFARNLPVRNPKHDAIGNRQSKIGNIIN